MTLVSSREATISAGVDLLKSLFVLPPHLRDIFSCSLAEFRVILVLPGAGRRL
jgi:hypothetical protein